MNECRATRHSYGFSLLEALAVIAVAAVLLALILPALGSGKRSANAATTQARFQQWALACTDYRSTYGRYPTLGQTGPELILETRTDTDRFVAVLTGLQADGTALTGDALTENPRRLRFGHFGPDMFAADGLLVDGFGNHRLLFVFDRDGDGWLRANEVSSAYLDDVFEGASELRGQLLIMGVGTTAEETLRYRQ